MLLTFTNDKGIYCAQADLYIDPWKPVKNAIITHAHADHARYGHSRYLAHVDSLGILKYRLGNSITIDTLNYNQPITINGVSISMHPAGHIIGSAQIRLEYKGEVWVVSGDYKVMEDGITTPFEVVKCHHFITESTFGMPIYNFEESSVSYQKLNTWIDSTLAFEQNAVVIGYSLGKSQRILHAIKNKNYKIILHSAVYDTNEALGIDNTPYIKFSNDLPKDVFKNCVVVAPPALSESAWLKKFGEYKLAICSGWMQLRGYRRRSNADIGFAISDHADWKGLLNTIKSTQAENIYMTHGYKSVLAKYVTEEMHLNAIELDTLFNNESIQTKEEI
jgi:putative mRNA 3-end processing factor